MKHILSFHMICSKLHILSSNDGDTSFQDVIRAHEISEEKNF